MSATPLPNDWYTGGVPATVSVGPDAYVDTSYAFAGYHGTEVALGRAAGVYDRTSFLVGEGGRVRVGEFACLNGTTIICRDRIEIGAYGLLAWGVVVSDSWPAVTPPVASRREALRRAAADPRRPVPWVDPARPVVIGDNVWVGFDSVIAPGVELGRGCVIACKTVVTEDVPDYAVLAGSPARVVRRLDADDDPEAVARALTNHVRP
jgi:galactoside O-acetyltransferase